MVSASVALRLFKAENCPHVGFADDGELGLVEWAEWEVSKVSRSLFALEGALGRRPEDIGTSVRDTDLIAFMSIMNGRLNAVTEALNIVLEMKIKAEKQVAGDDWG